MEICAVFNSYIYVVYNQVIKDFKTSLNIHTGIFD